MYLQTLQSLAHAIKEVKVNYRNLVARRNVAHKKFFQRGVHHTELRSALNDAIKLVRSL